MMKVTKHQEPAPPPPPATYSIEGLTLEQVVDLRNMVRSYLPITVVTERFRADLLDVLKVGR